MQNHTGLVEALKQARLELHCQKSSQEEHINFVNYDFSKRLSRFFAYINEIKKNYKRIAVYGNGLTGKLITNILGNQLRLVADKNAEIFTEDSYLVCKPEQLLKYKFDCIIISVMGREKEIRDYLINHVGLPSEVILYFDLVSDCSYLNLHQQNYSQLTERLKSNQSPIGQHPINIQIQTISTCNAKCYFCPYPNSWHDKNPGRMSDSNFKKLIDELSLYKIKKFCPYLENEPLLDNKIFEKLEYAINVLHPESVEIATNLSILNEHHIKGLTNVLSTVPHELKISFHGIDKDSYEEIMQLDFEKSLFNVKRLIEISQDSPLNVTIRGSGEPRANIKKVKHWFSELEFREFWQRELQGLKKQPKLDFFSYHDRTGQSQLKKNGVDFGIQRENLENFYCTRFDQWVHFLYTGEPILCCMDYNRETAIKQNIKNSTVNEIFSSTNYLKLIKQATGLCNSNKEFICKRCISPGG